MSQQDMETSGRRRTERTSVASGNLQCRIQAVIWLIRMSVPHSRNKENKPGAYQRAKCLLGERTARCPPAANGCRTSTSIPSWSVPGPQAGGSNNTNFLLSALKVEIHDQGAGRIGLRSLCAWPVDHPSPLAVSTLGICVPWTFSLPQRHQLYQVNVYSLSQSNLITFPANSIPAPDSLISARISSFNLSYIFTDTRSEPPQFSL